MAELATIARPYAEALFNASQGDPNGTSQWLDALAAVAGNPQLLQYAGNPKVGKQQVFDLVSEVARVQLPPAARTSCARSSRTAASRRCPKSPISSVR